MQKYENLLSGRRQTPIKGSHRCFRALRDTHCAHWTQSVCLCYTMTARGPCMPALLLILIHIMSVAESSDMITGFVGYNVTLPCSYDARNYGRLHVCWGRGEIPLTGGCGNEIITTDGFKVTRRKSHRYQLIGDLNQGDVSLTIIDAEMGDSGIYGCRVKIPGLFNDLKTQVTLTIQSYYGNYFTGSSAANTPQGSDHIDRSFIIIAAVILLLLLLVLVTGKQQREARSVPEVEHQTEVLVHYGNLGAHIGLQQRDGRV